MLSRRYYAAVGSGDGGLCIYVASYAAGLVLTRACVNTSNHAACIPAFPTVGSYSVVVGASVYLYVFQLSSLSESWRNGFHKTQSGVLKSGIGVQLVALV